MMKDHGSCTVCGQLVGISWLVDHFDETICHRCSGEPACWSCGSVTGGCGVRARMILADGRVRCRRCSVDAVDVQANVGTVVHLVRSLLHSYGIRLPNRVRVELVSLSRLAREASHGTHGLTVTHRAAKGRGTVAAIRVAEGMPATQFGQALAHEIGHGWLVGCPDGDRGDVEEEGICELVASWWLAERGGPFARHLLDGMAANPDRIYGEGFRLARRRTAGMTPAQIVERVSRTGSLGDPAATGETDPLPAPDPVAPADPHRRAGPVPRLPQRPV